MRPLLSIMLLLLLVYFFFFILSLLLSLFLTLSSLITSHFPFFFPFLIILLLTFLIILDLGGLGLLAWARKRPETIKKYYWALLWVILWGCVGAALATYLFPIEQEKTLRILFLTFCVVILIYIIYLLWRECMLIISFVCFPHLFLLLFIYLHSR
jgi:hypothetical protein